MAGTIRQDRRWKFGKITSEVFFDSNLTPYARLVFAVLDWHGEQSFPSVARMENMTGGLSPRRIRYALRELKDKGWLVRTARPGTTTLNWLTLPDTPAPRAAPSCTTCSTPGGVPLHHVQPPRNESESLSNKSQLTPGLAARGDRETPPETCPRCEGGYTWRQIPGAWYGVCRCSKPRIVRRQ